LTDKFRSVELRERSLAIDTPDGVVLVVGCSHSGMDKIAEAASTFRPRIHLIVGGFHLLVASNSDITSIIIIPYDTLKVEYIARGQRTGEPAFTALKKAFFDRFLYAGLATTLALTASRK
jgi:7,8-dihydropterin-6-yl-methyl-4-(beta-D-ribofuranosyl)aminobenzene 5'-phosphate synthase